MKKKFKQKIEKKNIIILGELIIKDNNFTKQQHIGLIS